MLRAYKDHQELDKKFRNPYEEVRSGAILASHQTNETVKYINSQKLQKLIDNS